MCALPSSEPAQRPLHSEVRTFDTTTNALLQLHDWLVAEQVSTATTYHDLGGDHHLRRDPDRARHRAIRALNQLGYTVTLNPIQEPTAA
jgi:hypothetical protein